MYGNVHTMKRDKNKNNNVNLNKRHNTRPRLSCEKNTSLSKNGILHFDVQNKIIKRNPPDTQLHACGFPKHTQPKKERRRNSEPFP